MSTINIDSFIEKLHSCDKKNLLDWFTNCKSLIPTANEKPHLPGP
jgi:hypothetical protein